MYLDFQVFVVISFYLFCIRSSESTTNIFEFQRNHTYENVTSTAKRIRTVFALSKLECLRACLATTGCAGFFYSKELPVCHIHSTVSFDLAHMVTSSDTSFYANVCAKFKYSYDARLRKYYMRYTSPKQTKTGAEDACNTVGGRLISLSEENEFFAMKSILGNITQINVSNEAFWVGAERNSTTAHFEWYDGSIVKKEFWEQGQPEYNAMSHDLTECVLLMPIFGFKLDDFQCNTSSSLKVYPLCECFIQYL